MKFRNIYSHRNEVKKGVTFEKPSRTKQEFENECNINTIMDRYACGQPLPVCSEPLYGDVSDIPTDFLEAQAKVLKAQEKFDSLPSEIRKRFDYSPQKMLEFIENPDNVEEGVKLGLFARNNNIFNNDSSDNSDNSSIINSNLE